MGSLVSKASRTAGSSATKRKYPKRAPSFDPPHQSARSAPPPPSSSSSSAADPPHQSAHGTLSPSSSSSPAAGPKVHPHLQASASKTEAINLDASDPTFARSLRTLGPVTPSSTLSNSSTFSPSPSPSSPQYPSNPALQILSARSRLAAEAQREFARAARARDDDDAARRRFVDVNTLRQVLMLRDAQGVPAAEIERRLRLGRGVVGMLGPKGVVGDVAGPA